MELTSEIRTLIDSDTGEPKVIVAVYEVNTGRTVLPIAFTPAEARTTAQLLIEAAEAIEHDAHTIAAMRSLKYDELAINNVIVAMRSMRGVSLNSATFVQSQDWEEEH